PVVLVVEDVHWADCSTRNLLTFLATAATAPLLLLLTMRTDELPAGDPIHAWLTSLERQTRAGRVHVERLSTSDLAELLAGIPGLQPSRAMAERICQRSDGNPFVAEELLARLRSGRTDLPPTVTGTVAARVASLPDQARRLVRAAAVAGSSATEVSHD